LRAASKEGGGTKGREKRTATMIKIKKEKKKKNFPAKRRTQGRHKKRTTLEKRESSRQSHPRSVRKTMRALLLHW